MTIAVSRVYLATPYGTNMGNGIFAKIRRWYRFRKVTEAAAYWMRKGFNVFSPITMTHPIGVCMGKNILSHEQWLFFDFEWIDHCDELWVYCQRGWEKSDGVAREIRYAKSLHMPVYYLKSNYKKWRTL